MDMSKLMVYKDNDIINASYKLTLSEQRLILSCVGQIRSDMPIEQNDYSVSVGAYASLFNITDKRAYHELKEVADRLFDRYVVIDLDSTNKLKTRWISHIIYDKDNRRLSIGFAPKLLPYLSQLKREFTKYQLGHVAKFTSVYAIRIYEFLIQQQHTEKKELTLSLIELREKLQVEDKHKLYGHLKIRVLDPAMEQINAHSNIIASYETKKEGRKVTAVHFKFKIKEGMAVSRDGCKNPNKHASDLEVKAKANPGESYAEAKKRIIDDKQTAKMKFAPTKEQEPEQGKRVTREAGLKHILAVKSALIAG